MEEEEARDAIVDLAVTTGKAKDRTSDIHTPPARSTHKSLETCLSLSAFTTEFDPAVN